jgi:methylthioribose-1-phosphate isomerase
LSPAVLHGTRNAPADVPVYNPAFDPTPMELVDYLVTETGVYDPPLDREAFAGDRRLEAD